MGYETKLYFCTGSTDAFVADPSCGHKKAKWFRVVAMLDLCKVGLNDLGTLFEKGRKRAKAKGEWAYVDWEYEYDKQDRIVCEGNPRIRDGYGDPLPVHSPADVLAALKRDQARLLLEDGWESRLFALAAAMLDKFITLYPEGVVISEGH